MIKYTHKENRAMVEKLSVRAREIGLLAEDESLEYRQGNTSYGHATQIGVIRKDAEGNRHNQMRPGWVPEFGYKDGPSTVGRIIVAFGDVIQFLWDKEIQRQSEESARKMRYLSEHVMRRSGRDDLPQSVTEYPHQPDSSFDQ